MDNQIFIIAHAPLASALHRCVQHVFPDRAAEVLALDVCADAAPAETLAAAQQLLKLHDPVPLLLLTDMLGATPCNVAQALLRDSGGRAVRLLAGVNLPMLLRAVTYQHEPLESLLARALAGGQQGVLQVNLSS